MIYDRTYKQSKTDKGTNSDSVLRIRIGWISKILAAWIRIRIRKNMQIQGAKYQQKLQRYFAPKTQIFPVKKNQKFLCTYDWFIKF